MFDFSRKNSQAGRDFLSNVARLVEESGAGPFGCEPGIAEGILPHDGPQMRDTLEGLCGVGFSPALDDFGTGYSSLGYLRSYPISKINIDRSFISNIRQEDMSREVVSAMIELAPALRPAVIAEGGETLKQNSGLAAAGCPRVQGNLFGGATASGAMDTPWRLVQGRPLRVPSTLETVH